MPGRTSAEEALVPLRRRWWFLCGGRRCSSAEEEAAPLRRNYQSLCGGTIGLFGIISMPPKLVIPFEHPRLWGKNIGVWVDLILNLLAHFFPGGRGDAYELDVIDVDRAVWLQLHVERGQSRLGAVDGDEAGIALPVAADGYLALGVGGEGYAALVALAGHHLVAVRQLLLYETQTVGVARAVCAVEPIDVYRFLRVELAGLDVGIVADQVAVEAAGDVEEALGGRVEGVGRLGGGDSGTQCAEA